MKHELWQYFRKLTETGSYGKVEGIKEYYYIDELKYSLEFYEEGVFLVEAFRNRVFISYADPLLVEHILNHKRKFDD